MTKRDNLKASVILPVYNYATSLRMTLSFFQNQTLPMAEFEIIVVDDGSQDDLREQIFQENWLEGFEHYKYVYQKNSGRAIARNTGAALAKSPLLIFCDADRLPEPDFVAKHIARFEKRSITIGCPWDCFAIKKQLQKHVSTNNIKTIQKFSRKPVYFTKMEYLYDQNGQTKSPIAWASLLIGNSSIDRALFEQVGGFDENFQKWGFEHFELGIRLLESGGKYKINPGIANYHIPHPREENFYKQSIEESVRVLKLKHKDKKVELVKEFLFGNISLQSFAEQYAKDVAPIAHSEPIFYKILA